MAPVRAELEAGAAGDAPVAVALDPEPHARVVEPGDREVRHREERVQRLDVRGAHGREGRHSAPPTAIPRPAAATQTTSIPTPFASAAPTRPACASRTVSRLAVLNVV
ncbi:hypothetical protein CMMCAS08_11770 [Clavibacter michiganensis subsp. michiganensis]|nr:hypothetical protein CMMCAS08_11770 [Clavibacter michiganensis subsp. michiganensis]